MDGEISKKMEKGELSEINGNDCHGAFFIERR
jgi:hypothetical protein